MKVAFIGGRGLHSNYGGVENAIREIATRLARDPNLEVEVYGRGTGNGFNVRREDSGITVVEAPQGLSRYRGNAVLSIANCLYALLVRRPRVLLLFASGPSLLAIPARLLGIRVVAALRAMDSQRDKWGVLSTAILRLGEFSATRIAHRCTVNSLEMYNHFSNAARHLTYIPNGASTAHHGSDEVLRELGLVHNHYLLFAARLDPAKRLHLLLQAYRHLPKDCRLPLVVAGGQCHCPEYQHRLETLSVPGVTFLGHVGKDILDPLMRNCAVFILPSVKEGMSNSLLSAMQCGRCVLCSDIEPNSEVVRHDPDTLFKTDDLESLTAALTEACRNPQLRRERGRRMQAIATRQFSWDITASRYLALIQSEAAHDTTQHQPDPGYRPQLQGAGNMTHNPPAISVIITAFNRPDFLRSAIDSVSAQTFPVEEIIVVDDCSPTNLQEVIREFDFPVRYLRMTRRGGANHARNRGVQQAGGKYVAFLDDDDIWLPHKLASQVPQLEHAVACIGGYEYLDNGNAQVQRIDLVNAHMLKRGNTFCGMSGLICRRDWLLENPFDEQLRNGQDWDIYIRLARSEPIRYVARPLFRYRRGGHDSITTQLKKQGPEDMPQRLAVAYKHRDWLGEYHFRRRVAHTILGYIGHRREPLKLVLLAMQQSGLLATLRVLSEKFGNFMKRGGKVTSH